MSIVDDYRQAKEFTISPEYISVRPVTPDDWQAYKNYYKGLSDPHHFSGFLVGKDLDAPETYQELFDNTISTGDMVIFGLWHKDRMIGQSAINFFDTDNGKQAFLAGSEVADNYRGQRLVNNFYHARMAYLANIKFTGEVYMTISEENSSSQKAAERNGFENTGKMDRNGSYIYVPTSDTLKKHNINCSGSKMALK